VGFDRSELIQTFMRHVSHWSWVHILYTYDDSHLLIADDWFISELRTARPDTLSLRTAKPHNYQDAITDKIKEVLVFCEEGELALVKKIQAEHPELHVTSGTYGFACVGVDRYARLKAFAPQTRGRKIVPTLILSTPYADAEFVTNVMTKAGMPETCEYMGRPFESWLKLHKNFQVTRYYATTKDFYVKKKQLSWLMQTDVLQAVFDNTSYSLKRFIADLNRLGAKVVLVSRKRTSVQAVTAQVFARTAERSVWTKSPTKKIISNYEDGDFTGCIKWEQDIQSGQAILDAVAARVSGTMPIVLEDFIMDQGKYITKIAQYLGYELSGEPEPEDYIAGYETTPHTHTISMRFQRELIDRLGLHVEAKVWTQR